MTALAAPPSLTRILALRMAAVAVLVSLLLTLFFAARTVTDIAQLRESTLKSSAMDIALALNKGENPAKLRLYRDFPHAYGFPVFDRRLLARRHILAAANTQWLPAVQHVEVDKTKAKGDNYSTAVGSDLFEEFERFHPSETSLGGHAVSLLIHRVVLGGHKYWIQVYMIGDPAWASLSIVIGEVTRRALVPALMLVPALTLAIFLATRAALLPLRKLSGEANVIAGRVARGQKLVPVPETGMAREFADVAAAINAMLSKLERSLEVQKQFASDAAHELRTPLAVVLLEAAQLPPGAARERIKKDLAALGDLVNDLLRFAQAEDVMANEQSAVDVVACARKVCEEAAGRAVGRRQMIEFDTTLPSLTLRGSSALIEIAIRNLVENALKYSPRGATVFVRLGPGPVVEIEDQGPGIPADQRQAIFDRFWRANRQPGDGDGTGIGLSLVRRIAQLHDGEISLAEAPSGGTRMILDFTPRAGARALSA